MTTPSRTEDLGHAECWELLRGGVVGRLCVVSDGEPDIFPVNYAVDHGSIVFRTRAGTKLSAAVHGPVAFEIDGLPPEEQTAWSVVVRGRAEEIREKDDIITAMSLDLVPWQEGAKPRFVRILPSTVSGRRLRTSQDPEPS